MSYLHKNLDFLMRIRRETQASVAEFVGVTQPAVFNWLRDTMPRPEQIEKIAQYFEVTVDDLVKNELPHRRNVEALTELERELKNLENSWTRGAKGMKEKAEKMAGGRNYDSAAQLEWMATSMDRCSGELSKILETYFPGDKQNKNVEQQAKSNDSPPASNQ